MRTSIYIDGFNFYYLAVKGTPYKWLDFKEVFTKILHSENKIISINYFTAIVDGKRDPRNPIPGTKIVKPSSWYFDRNYSSAAK